MGRSRSSPKCQFQVTPASQLKTWWIEHRSPPPSFLLLLFQSSSQARASSPSHLVRLSATITQGAAQRERERIYFSFFLLLFTIELKVVEILFLRERLGTFVIGADAQFNWRVSVLYPFGDNLRDKKDTNRRRKEFTLFTKDTKKKKKMKSFFFCSSSCFCGDAQIQQVIGDIYLTCRQGGAHE